MDPQQNKNWQTISCARCYHIASQVCHNGIGADIGLYTECPVCLAFLKVDETGSNPVCKTELLNVYYNSEKDKIAQLLSKSFLVVVDDYDQLDNKKETFSLHEGSWICTREVSFDLLDCRAYAKEDGQMVYTFEGCLEQLSRCINIGYAIEFYFGQGEDEECGAGCEIMNIEDTFLYCQEVQDWMTLYEKMQNTLSMIEEQLPFHKDLLFTTEYRMLKKLRNVVKNQMIENDSFYLNVIAPYEAQKLTHMSNGLIQ